MFQIRKKTGIIAPYKNQVEALSKEITDIDAATVHKFQGREKENIIISTVDDEISDFADDPYLINVALSRAKKKLMLVVTGNEQSKERNITDLIDYISIIILRLLKARFIRFLITFTSSILRKEGYICRSTKKYQNMIRKT